MARGLNCVMLRCKAALQCFPPLSPIFQSVCAYSDVSTDVSTVLNLWLSGIQFVCMGCICLLPFGDCYLILFGVATVCVVMFLVLHHICHIVPPLNSDLSLFPLKDLTFGV